jgi:hypothetical protein
MLISQDAARSKIIIAAEPPRRVEVEFAMDAEGPNAYQLIDLSASQNAFRLSATPAAA